ncbi:hypothetical protein Q8A67_005321 [Cirrhinus molitorella]|uniref:Uncharacterized protein n=1 Tax=Cirrhinus molitorella TaxID=172907 RepID=A0AA88U410_9TELE|nr:hypothetical protein Q8A67_005321 [Cirrhinus molitorella]
MSQKEEREEDTASKVSCDHPTKSQPSAFSGAEMTSEPNCDQPMKNLPSAFSNATVTSDPSISRMKRQRSESPDPSCVSVKSSSTRRKRRRSESPESSSMDQPPLVGDAPATSDLPSISLSALFLKEREDKDTASKMSSPSPELSGDQPMKNLTTTSHDEAETSEPRTIRKKEQRSQSPEPSRVSMKSSRSMEQPPKLSDSTVASHPLLVYK